MKVILNEEVIGLGEPGKIVDVAPGYARNFLVPRKLAVYANTANVREMEHHKRRLDRKRQRLQEAARTVGEQISAKLVVIETKAGQGGKLFGSVTTTDLAAALKNQLDLTIDRRKIHLKEPIRTLGEHEATVHLLGDTHAILRVTVVDPSQPAKVDAPVAPTPQPSVVEAIEDVAETTAE